MKEKIYRANQPVSKSSNIISSNSSIYISSLKLTPIASLLILLFSSPSSFANGLQGMEVIAGKAHMEVNGVTTTIKNSPNAILNWKSFNINKGDLVQFIQENKNSAVFNKVVSNQLSELYGTLKSNGQVFLINPNGIIFGKDAVIDTSSFVASTLNISSEDLKKGKFAFEQAKDKAMAEIVNNGLITVSKNGTVAFVGGSVTNNGKIKVENGNVFLLAGQKITLSDLSNPTITYSLSAPKNKVLNLGDVFAKNGKITLSGGKVTNKGTLNVHSTDKDKQGKVTISAKEGDVSLGGKISADGVYRGGAIKITGKGITVEENAVIDLKGKQGGGIAYIGGDEQGKGTIQLAEKTEIKKGAKIDASATEKGNGGKVVIWGDKARVDGKITAKGGEKAGDGGFVETSGKTISLGENLDVDASAKNGKGGEWLLDPEELRILSEEDFKFHTEHEIEYKKENGKNYDWGYSYISSLPIQKSLNLGMTITQEANKDLYWQDGINITSGTNAVLNLKAGRDLNINNINIGSAINPMLTFHAGRNIYVNNPIVLSAGIGNKATLKLNAEDEIIFTSSSSSLFPRRGYFHSKSGQLDLHLTANRYSKGDDYSIFYTTDSGKIDLIYAIKDGGMSPLKYGNGNVYLKNFDSHVTVELDNGNIYYENDIDTVHDTRLVTHKGEVIINKPERSLSGVSIQADKVIFNAKKVDNTNISGENIELTFTDNSNFEIKNKDIWNEISFSFLDDKNKRQASAKLKGSTVEILSSMDSFIDVNSNSDTMINVNGTLNGNIKSIGKTLIKANSVSLDKILSSDKGIQIISKEDVITSSPKTKGDFLVKAEGVFKGVPKSGNIEISAKNIYSHGIIESTGYVKLQAENVLIKARDYGIISNGDIAIKTTGAIYLDGGLKTNGTVRLFEGNASDRRYFPQIFNIPIEDGVAVYNPNKVDGVEYTTSIPNANSMHGRLLYRYINAKNGIYINGGNYPTREDNPVGAYVFGSNMRWMNANELYPKDLDSNNELKSEAIFYPFMSASGFRAVTDGNICLNNLCNDGSILVDNTFGDIQKIDDPWEVVVPPKIDKSTEEQPKIEETLAENPIENVDKPTEESPSTEETPVEIPTENVDKSTEETLSTGENPVEVPTENVDKLKEDDSIVERESTKETNQLTEREKTQIKLDFSFAENGQDILELKERYSSIEQQKYILSFLKSEKDKFIKEMRDKSKTYDKAYKDAITYRENENKSFNSAKKTIVEASSYIPGVGKGATYTGLVVGELVTSMRGEHSSDGYKTLIKTSRDIVIDATDKIDKGGVLKKTLKDVARAEDAMEEFEENKSIPLYKLMWNTVTDLPRKGYDVYYTMRSMTGWQSQEEKILEYNEYKAREEADNAAQKVRQMYIYEKELEEKLKGDK